MKAYLKILSLAALSLGLANCKVSGKEGEFEILIGGPQPVKPIYSKLEYFDGGWYGPSPNYRLRLTMNVLSNGKIQGDFDNTVCKTQFQAELNDYVELEQLVLQAKYTIGKGFTVDGGSESIALGEPESSHYKMFYLRDGDQSFDKNILEKADAEKVRDKVQAIAEKVQNAGNCSQPSGLNSVRWEEEARREDMETFTIPPRQSDLRTDVTVEFKSSVVSVRGTRKESAFCKRTLKHVVVNPEALIQAASLIEIRHNEEACAAFSNSPVSKFTIISGNTIDFGFLGCLNSSHALNTEKFQKLVDSMFQKIQPKCEYPED